MIRLAITLMDFSPEIKGIQTRQQHDSRWGRWGTMMGFEDRFAFLSVSNNAIIIRKSRHKFFYCGLTIFMLQGNSKSNFYFYCQKARFPLPKSFFFHSALLELFLFLEDWIDNNRKTVIFQALFEGCVTLSTWNRLCRDF